LHERLALNLQGRPARRRDQKIIPEEDPAGLVEQGHAAIESVKHRGG
jgi:hypothetical protein